MDNKEEKTWEDELFTNQKKVKVVKPTCADSTRIVYTLEGKYFGSYDLRYKSEADIYKTKFKLAK